MYKNELRGVLLQANVVSAYRTWHVLFLLQTRGRIMGKV